MIPTAFLTVSVDNIIGVVFCTKRKEKLSDLLLIKTLNTIIRLQISDEVGCG
jgi:hypothetical protein